MHSHNSLRRRLVTLAALALLALTLGAGPLPNIVVNGDCEKGTGAQAEGWSKLDGLTTHWDKNGHPGRCLRFDTTVLKVDKAKFEQAEKEAKAAPAGRSSGGQYDTVGAHEGVWAFAQPIAIQPDDQYFVISADVKSPARSTALFYPQVFIRGYQRFDAARDSAASSYFHVPHAGGPAYGEMFGAEQRAATDGDYLMVYRHSLVCRAPDLEWHSFQMAVKLPTMKKYRPDVILLKPYAMWPLGSYLFDNVSFRRVDQAEYDRVKKLGHSIEGFMPTGEK